MPAVKLPRLRIVDQRRPLVLYTAFYFLGAAILSENSIAGEEITMTEFV
jgi:hypothetical protein